MKRILTVVAIFMLVSLFASVALAQEEQGFFCESDLDCAEFNLPGISSCSNDPDTNPFTWDYALGVISTCNMELHECIIPTYNFVHNCDMSRCGAGCESRGDCRNKCVGNVFYSGGTCVSCNCNYATQDCDLSDGWYDLGLNWVELDQCNEKEQQAQEYRDYSCSDSGCTYVVTESQATDTGLVRNKPDFTVCDDGLWCTVEDSCQIGECVAQPRDCSANDIFGVSTCDSNPDNNPFTFDFREAFTSICNEELDICTTGSELITSACDKERCGAECEINVDCLNMCEGNVFYSSGLCQEGCTCTYALQDCDLLDGWYFTSLTQWIDIDQCYEKQQQDQEYREYSCSLAGCEYIITTNRWVDTGSERGKPDFTPCDDGLWCTVDDSCQMGVCVAQPRDCSVNDIFDISTCDSNPDNNPFTFDFREAFTSICDEELDICTTGSELIVSACDKERCGAECEANADCAATDCSHLDGCHNNHLFSCQDVFNACESTCGCEHNSCVFDQQCGWVGRDSDNDGWDRECGDCDDTSAAVYPGAPEIIGNGIDEDCNGEDFIPCKIITPEAKSYNTDFIPIKVECEMPPWQIRYSIDGTASKIFCWECENFEILTRFHEGYNDIMITAAYTGKTTHSHSVRFLVDSHEPFINNVLPMSGYSSGGFDIYYTEQNLKTITMYYRQKGTGSYHALSRDECPSGREKCYFQPDLSGYDWKDIEYYFVLEDLAGNTKTSPTYAVKIGAPPVYQNSWATSLFMGVIYIPSFV